VSAWDEPTPAFSNGTDFEIWSSRWCFECARDVNEDCPIVGLALSHEPTPQLVRNLETHETRCTEWQPRKRITESQRPVCFGSCGGFPVPEIECGGGQAGGTGGVDHGGDRADGGRAAAELIEQQQAAIQRARDVCEDKYVGPATTYGEGFQNGYNDALYRVLRALNGLCPICSGPIRETVGLVCQTCGTDYGASDE